MKYASKYSLSQKENIFLAKKYLVKSVWGGVHLEGFNMTYPETETVINSGRLKNADPDAVICANNLKRGWRYLLNNLGSDAPPLDLEYLCTLNGIVAANDSLDPGELRTGAGGIGGTTYKPPILSRGEVSTLVDNALEIKEPTERAIEFFLLGSKGQFFWDGNKRTSLLALNRILIENGAGMLQITPDNLEEFNNVLHRYYEHDEKDPLRDFLYHTAITAEEFGE